MTNCLQGSRSTAELRIRPCLRFRFSRKALRKPFSVPATVPRSKPGSRLRHYLSELKLRPIDPGLHFAPQMRRETSYKGCRALLAYFYPGRGAPKAPKACKPYLTVGFTEAASIEGNSRPTEVGLSPAPNAERPPGYLAGCVGLLTNLQRFRKTLR